MEFRGPEWGMKAWNLPNLWGYEGIEIAHISSSNDIFPLSRSLALARARSLSLSLSLSLAPPLLAEELGPFVVEKKSRTYSAI